MAMLINEECINCGACEPECENHAITEGEETYVIDPDRCTECVGIADEPKCIGVCPADDCIVKDPRRAETRQQLKVKYQALHSGA